MSLTTIVNNTGAEDIKVMIAAAEVAESYPELKSGDVWVDGLPLRVTIEKLPMSLETKVTVVPLND